MADDTDRWIDEVVSVLAPQFEWDAEVTLIARRQLRRCVDAGGVPAGFEFICDSPRAANARLKRSLDGGPFTLRVADYRLSIAGTRAPERFGELNERLGVIRAPKRRRARAALRAMIGSTPDRRRLTTTST